MRNYKLREIAEIIGGFAFKSGVFTDIGIPVIKIADIYSNSISTSGCSKVAVEHLRGLDRFKLSTGDIVMAMTGATTGKVGRHLTNEAAYVNQRVARLRAKHPKATQNFLWAIVSQAGFAQVIKDAAGGSAQENISTDGIGDIEIELPDEDCWTQIGETIACLDQRTGANKHLSHTLEEMSQALFKSWFVDFDPVVAKSEGRKPFGMSDDIAALFPDSFEESELGAVPKGWRVGTLSQLCDSVQTGGTPSRSQTNYWVGGTIPWVKTGELNDGFISNTEEAITELGLKSSNCKLWGPGTVILALYGATVGKLGVLAKTATANQACAALIPSRRFGFPFILNQVLAVRTELCSLAIGAAQQNLNLSTVREFRMVVPEDFVSAAFDQIVRPFYQQIECLCAQNRLLEDCRSLLLPRLLSGEISERSVASPEATAA